MKTKTCYVKPLHLLFLFALIQISNSLSAQIVYEGFGANAVGGSNSTTVYHVTNTNSSGAGSLANGIGSNRTIVFDVSGTIIGRFDLISISYLTIDATGQNITIDNQDNGDAISFDGANTHHCILKGLHVTNAGGDGINVVDGSHDIMITNCTSWGNRDGNIDVAGDNSGITKNVTVQWCIIGGGAPNNSSYSGGTLVTGQSVTLHHNLYSPAAQGDVGERNPLVHCNYSPVGSPNCDVRNNVVWKFGRNNATGSGYGTNVSYNGAANVVNNWYYSPSDPGNAVVVDGSYGNSPPGNAYVNGNVSGNNNQNPNNQNNHAEYTIPAQYAVAMQSACVAAQLVLANAGPSPRNAQDLAFINAVSLTNCPASGNQPPVANAGLDKTVTLPATPSITGTGNDPDGSIASYAWSKQSGPAGGTLSTPNSSTTTITALQPGIYVFKLTVTDNQGATGIDSMRLTVNAAANLPPIVEAGVDKTVTLPIAVAPSITGTASDPDGSIASTVWTKRSGPAGGTLSTPNSLTTTITALQAGTYVFRLTVTDNLGATAFDSMRLIVNPAVNIPPTANAGTDQTVTLPATVTLNGTGNDPDGSIAGFAWVKLTGPAGGTLSAPNQSQTNVTALQPGTYTFKLTVTDNLGATGTDTVRVIVNAAANIPPTANAGIDQTVTLPATVTLTGTGNDPDGSIAGFAWVKLTGPAGGTLSAPNQSQTNVTALQPGTYTFKLTVTDNLGATVTDTVRVIVNAANIPPTANAGTDVSVTLPGTASLTGSGNDPDGTIAGFAWVKLSGPAGGTLSAPNQFQTNVTALQPGTYTFKLTVTDNLGATGTDTVRVIVNAAANIPPTANAGSDATVTLPGIATLLGTGNDPDGSIAGFAWIKLSGPAGGTLSAPNQSQTNVTALQPGTYTFKLTVTDNLGATGTDTVRVIVNAAPNQPPTANAGSDINVTLPGTASLVGIGNDPDGSIAGYAWVKVSGPAGGTLSAPNQSQTNVTALQPGTYTFKLTVTDNLGATGVDSVRVIVTGVANQPPVANAGNNQSINQPNSTGALDGRGSFDPDGTITGYSWTFVSGPATPVIGTPTQSQTGVTGLTTAGTYVFQLRVTDNNGATDDDNVTIIVSNVANIPPVADAGNNITMTLPENSTNLNGGGSTDPDGVINTYAWSYVSGPVGGSYTIVNPDHVATGLNGLSQGVYRFLLTVTDNDGASSTDEIVVTVNAAINLPPVVNAGSDVTLTLPDNSTMLAGTAYDPDGTIATYAWTYVSGPVGGSYTIVSPPSGGTGINNLVQGVYVFKLTVTDNKGAIARDSVKITVNAAVQPANQPPVANAGSDITLILPQTSTMLAGTAYDPDGTIVSSAWSLVSGPNTYTINNPNSIGTGLTNLGVGTYVFKLTVTDNRGATATDMVTITVVLSANQAPSANAGADFTITLPTNTATLYGSGADADGTITSYAWAYVSGPAGYTIANAGSAITGLYNLGQGTYIFKLTVTDNRGATATDIITIIVNAAPPAGNQPPVARTENDITITLPTNTTQLHGNTSSDPDGVIVSYQWTQLSGPASSLITGGQSSIVTVSELTTGIYTFELKVTDDDGATSTKTIKVTVNNPVNAKNVIKVYPNPTPGGLNLQYVSNANGKLRIRIYDANRRLMKDEAMDKTQVSVTKTFDVSLYGRGVYFIEVLSEDGKEKTTSEFMKM